MVRVPTVEEYLERLVEGCLRTYVEGGRYTRNRKPMSLNWLIGEIRGAGVYGDWLREIFKRVEGYGDSTLLEQARRTCEELGLLRHDLALE